MARGKIGFMQGRLSPLVDGKIQAFPWDCWSEEFSVANENDFKSKKHGNLVGKKVLRKSLSKLLPEKIINYKKQGFSSPDASWFKGDSIEYVRTVLNKSNDFLDQKTTLSILEEHASGSINRRLAIWSLLYLIQFENIFMH